MAKPTFTPQKGDSPKIKRNVVAVGRHYPNTRFRTAADIPRNRKERRAAVKLKNMEKAKCVRHSPT